MSYLNRISEFERGDDVQIQFVNDRIIQAEYIVSNAECVAVVNEEGLFTLPLANILWIRKDLLKGENE